MTGTTGASPFVSSRRSRRTLVLAVYLGYVALVLAWALLPVPLRWVAVALLGLLVLTAVVRLLQPQRLGISEGPDAALDVRQIAARNGQYLNAYRVLGAFTIFLALYYMLAQDGSWWLPRSLAESQLVFWAVWIFAVTLPTALIAWTEDEPLPE